MEFTGSLGSMIRAYTRERMGESNLSLGHGLCEHAGQTMFVPWGLPPHPAPKADRANKPDTSSTCSSTLVVATTNASEWAPGV